MTNAYESYLESTILSADPLELIAMLYRGAQEAVSRALTAVDRGDIPQRAREITKASEILTELAFSLNHEQGGEISRNLTELYDYMQRKLIQANSEQRREPLVEVIALLNTLREGWEACRASLRGKGQEPVRTYAQPSYPDYSSEYEPLSLTA